MLRPVAVCAAVVVLASGAAVPAAQATSRPAALPVGLTRLLAGTPTGVVSAVATFAHRPSPTDLSALTRLGLRVQGLHNLPLALVSGPVAQLQAAVINGVARDVYPNERLRSFEDEPETPDPSTAIRESGASIGVDTLHKRGLTGKGVGVAIVDSGVDATHPDLADHVAHNVKVVGPGYPAYPSTGPNFVLPLESTTNDSDLAAGHGTHVAGIVAADGTTAPDQVGMAPDASLNAYSVGELFIHSVLGAFDDILTHQKDRNIRVINNSWGTSFRFFDPGDPVNVATKALSDAGVVVVFAAGNDGAEMTINPYSVAPWVISVGSTTIARKRSGFSSEGLDFDNSTSTPDVLDGHRLFRGAGPGLYHPDVSAPGTNITASSSAPGLIMAPNLPCKGQLHAPCTATISGTSMASPHVAGMAALLIQANPKLTPSQVRVALQSAATPLADGSTLGQSGYGIVNGKAVDLVAKPGFAKRLKALQRGADRRVAGEEDYRVSVADYWGFTAAPVDIGGSVPHEFTVQVPAGTRALKVAVAFPAMPPPPVPVGNRGGYEALLYDATGRFLARATPSRDATTTLLFPVAGSGVAFGTWTLRVRSVGALGIDTLTPELPGERTTVDSVAVTLAQLVAPVPR
jgi:serine protease AprX